MLKTKHNLIAIGILGIALAIAIVVVGGVSWHRASAPMAQPQTAENTSPAATTSTASSTLAARVFTPHPPHGSVTYQIAQAATQLPGFVQATIDPVDVSVGQIQHFTIITDDPNPIVSVVAEITTDHKVITVPLASQGVPAVSMLVPHTITVGADNRLALVTPGQSITNADAANIKQGANVANAATTNDTKFTGQWTVEDTHTAKYQTTFIAKDSAGNTNSVTLQWTDPCPFASDNNYAGVTTTLNVSCTIQNGVSGISAVDGVEHGNLAVGTGGSLTISASSTLVVNTGYSIFLSGGSISIPTGGQIVLGRDMCGTDNDGDGYIAASDWTASTSCGAMVSRTNLAVGGFGDCNDNNVNVHPNQTEFFATGTTTDLGANTYDYNCDGNNTASLPGIGSITSIGSCGGGGMGSCNGEVASYGWQTTVPACGQSGTSNFFPPNGTSTGGMAVGLIACSSGQSGYNCVIGGWTPMPVQTCH